MFDTAEMTDLRATATEARSQTCTIRYVSGQASDGMGGFTDTWSDRATGVTVRIRPVNGDPNDAERVIADRLASAMKWVLCLPANQSVEAGDQIVVGSRVFEVAGVVGAVTYEAERLVVCTENLPS